MLEEKVKKLAAKPSFKQLKIFNENLVAEERAKVELTLNQPIYEVFFITDLAKVLMYGSHYNYIKRKYPDWRLLFTDTDSLTFQIQTSNVYKEDYAEKHLFDFSGYAKENPLCDGENKKTNR